MVFGEAEGIGASEEVFEGFKRDAVTPTGAKQEQIIKGVSFVGAGAQTLFTVPENKTLFISSVWMSIDMGVVTSADPQPVHRLEVQEQDALLLAIVPAGTEVSNTATNQQASTSYPMPVKVNQFETVKLTILGAVGAGGFTGWLQDKDI